MRAGLGSLTSKSEFCVPCLERAGTLGVKGILIPGDAEPGGKRKIKLGAAVYLSHREVHAEGARLCCWGVEATDSESLMGGRNWVKGRARRKPCRGGGSARLVSIL